VSCHEAQDNQVLQDIMEQPYYRRSNMGKRGFTSYRSEGTCDCSLSLYDLSSFQISARDFVLGGSAVAPHVSNLQDYVNHIFKGP
jgi:hypothetical protein